MQTLSVCVTLTSVLIVVNILSMERECLNARPIFLPSMDRSNEEHLLHLIIKQGYLVEKGANLRRDSEKQFHFPPPHVQECRKVRVRTVKLRIPQNLGPTYESYDCETFSVVLE